MAKVINRKIKKDMYYLYSDEALDDFYDTIDIKGERYLLDAEGNRVGQMISPPSPDGITWSGCTNDSCQYDWSRWREHANGWYTKWCDSCINLSSNVNPSYGADPSSKEAILQGITASSIYYVLAHGGSTSCNIDYVSNLSQADVKGALFYRGRMLFTFLGHCGAMINTGRHTFCDAFSQGSTTGCAVVGYYDMGNHLDAWAISREWQECFFTEIDKGQPIYIAYENSLLDYPEMEVASRFYGDTTFTFLTSPLSLADITPGQPIYDYGDEITITVSCSGELGATGKMLVYIDDEYIIDAYVYFEEVDQVVDIDLAVQLDAGDHSCTIYNEDMSSSATTPFEIRDETGAFIITDLTMNTIRVGESGVMSVCITNTYGNACVVSATVYRETTPLSTVDLEFSQGEIDKTFEIDGLPVENAPGDYLYCVVI